MASVALLFFGLMLSAHVGNSIDSQVKLKCDSAVGDRGQSTHISCSIEPQNKHTKPIINTVVITRSGEKKPCFTFQPHNNKVTGDPRFKALSDSSLQIQNTDISDEGEYRYLIRTSLGEDTTKFIINVTAKYNNPAISSEPETIKKNGRANFFCTASGGYPAGAIHWFVQHNTNWTNNSKLKVTKDNEGFYTLSSQLVFDNFDTLWGPIRCVVLNSKFQEEEASTFTLEIIEEMKEDVKTTPSTVTIIIAVGIVIGSLIVILVVTLLLCRRRRSHQLRKARSMDLQSYFYNPADADENFAPDEPAANA